MSSSAIRVGVLAAVEAGDHLARIDAAVVRLELERRLGSVVVSLRTTLPISPPTRYSDWKPLLPSSWPGDVDAVVVDSRVSPDDRARCGADASAVETDLWSQGTPLAALLESGVDPIAVDARRRMIDHLGLAAADLDATPIAPSAIDLLVLARRGELDGADARVAALREGRSTPGSDLLAAEFDRLTAAIGTGSGEPWWSPDAATQLAEERRARQLDQRLAADALDAAHDEIARLRRQLDAAALRAELATPDP